MNVEMAAGSQPGDLAYAKGELYVAEDFGSPPALAIVDAETGDVFRRIPVGAGMRPHHVHASVGGNLVAFGLYGTDLVGVVDTRTDALLGTWDTNPETANGRGSCGGVLEEREHPVRRQRRDEPDRRARSAQRRCVLANDRSERARAGGHARRQAGVRLLSGGQPAPCHRPRGSLDRGGRAAWSRTRHASAFGEREAAVGWPARPARPGRAGRHRDARSRRS